MILQQQLLQNFCFQTDVILVALKCFQRNVSSDTFCVSFHQWKGTTPVVFANMFLISTMKWYFFFIFLTRYMSFNCNSPPTKRHKYHKKIVEEKNRGLLTLETASFAFQFKEGGGVFEGDKTVLRVFFLWKFHFASNTSFQTRWSK